MSGDGIVPAIVPVAWLPRGGSNDRCPVPRDYISGIPTPHRATQGRNVTVTVHREGAPA